MPCIMKISEKNFRLLFNAFLVLIAATIIFRKPCTWILIAFVLFNMAFIKKVKLSKKAVVIGVVIALPFLLEVLFFWNNSSVSAGLKSAEKTASLLLLPIFIMGNYRWLTFNTVLLYYSRTVTIIVLIFFLRFLIFYPEYVDKYLNGIHLWEMGYVFARTLGIHAPALNMHLAFVAIVNFYFVLKHFKGSYKNYIKAVSIISLALSVFFVLLVNTRMALFNVFAGIVIVLFYQMVKSENVGKVIKTASISLILLFGVTILFVSNNPYMKEKYSSVTFAHMDKVGRLDEIKDPQIHVFNSLVTRVSIWKSAWELSKENLPLGVGGADGKDQLIQYYKDTNQHFLAKYEFPVHNQFLDSLLKFGIVGFLAVILYMLNIAYLGFTAKNGVIVAFFVLFFTSNLMDDFLVRFDGIVFSGLWISIFGAYWLQLKDKTYKDRPIV